MPTNEKALIWEIFFQGDKIYEQLDCLAEKLKNKIALFAYNLWRQNHSDWFGRMLTILVERDSVSRWPRLF